MTKNEAQAIAKTNGMEIMRHPITNEAWGYMLSPNKCSEALDALYNAFCSDPKGFLPCAMEVSYYGTDSNGNDLGALYRLICPETWFDLTGEV